GSTASTDFLAVHHRSQTGRGIRAPLRSVLGGIIARRLRLTEPWHFGLVTKTPVVLPAAGVFSSREIRMRKGKARRGMSRREFGVLSAAALATPFIGFGSNESPANSATADPQVTRKPTGESKQGLNVVFLFGDQERYFAKWPKGLSLPGHERLQ